MKSIVILVFFLISNHIFAQTKKDSLLSKNAKNLIEELRFIYELDQSSRKYLDYGTFSRNVIDSIEELEQEEIKNSAASLELSKQTKTIIWKKILSPLDSIKAERMMEIIKDYGYPSVKRLEKFSGLNIEFNPIIILVHTPFNFKDRMIPLIAKENSLGNIPNSCEYGWLLWHLNGRTDFSFMLENGYEMKTNPDGTFQLVSTCN